MIFASIEASALPFRVGQPVNVYPQEFGTIVVRALEPAHPANPILVEFRKIKNKYGTVADSARWCLENGVWAPDSSLLGGRDVTHAHKVLSRLANWKEGNR